MLYSRFCGLCVHGIGWYRPGSCRKRCDLRLKLFYGGGEHCFEFGNFRLDPHGGIGSSVHGIGWWCLGGDRRYGSGSLELFYRRGDEQFEVINFRAK